MHRALAQMENLNLQEYSYQSLQITHSSVLKIIYLFSVSFI